MFFARFLILLSLTIPTFASSIKKVHVQNLNLDYFSPKGIGSVEKLSVGLSKKSLGTYALEIEKVETALVLRTEFLDLTWSSPGDFLLSLENIVLKNLNLNFDTKTHMLKASEFSFKTSAKKDYLLQDIDLLCDGSSRIENLGNRILDDCREKMLLKISKVEVPIDFVLNDILEKVNSGIVDELPVSDFYLSSEAGEFYLYFYARYYVSAGLRTYGTFEYSPDYKTITIKVNKIKFGILSVTNLVMNELKKRVKNPNIKIDPPYIRVSISSEDK